MQIMIDIPEYYYKTIKEIPAEYSTADMLIIKNGTPLPKGHGRLIDADEVLKAMNTWDKFGYTETGCFVREPGNDYVPYVHYEDMVKAVNGTQTIIKADKETQE